MIKLTVRGVAEKRGFTTAYQLQKACALQPSVASRIWKGTLTRMDFGVLDKLCKVLKSKPNNLLNFDPDS